MKKILFVCTGNVFRSMTAEKCFNDYIKKEWINWWTADSAGTFEAKQDYVDAVVLRSLIKLGINASQHKPKRITKDLIEEADIVIAMASSHKYFIKRAFKVNIPLFNEIFKNESTSVDDQDDVVDDKYTQREEAAKYLAETVKYLHDAMPDFVKNIEKV